MDARLLGYTGSLRPHRNERDEEAKESRPMESEHPDSLFNNRVGGSD